MLSSENSIRIYLACLLSMVLIAFDGCVRTSDFEDCEFPLRLKFSYTYNREGLDLLKNEVSYIELQLYDSDTDALVKHTRVPVGELDEGGGYFWYVPAGHFTLVAWGRAGSRYDILIGKRIIDAGVRLSANSNGEVPHQSDHLWHTLLTDIFINGDVSPVYSADLRKISNDVEVNVSYADGRNLSMPVNCDITASNALYQFNGQISPASPHVKYLPGSLSRADDDTFCFTTLGLSEGDDSMLRVTYGQDVIYDGSLTAIIGERQDVDFGLDDDFKLHFIVIPDSGGSDNTIMVMVNGWHVMDYNVILNN